MLDSLDEDNIDSFFDELARVVDNPISVENVKTDLGYNGIHITWRDADGLGYEVQLTTPEIWDTKKKSDAIYDRWRNVKAEELNANPKKMLEFLNDKNESKNMWKTLWNKLGYENGTPDFSWVENIPYDVADFM